MGQIVSPNVSLRTGRDENGSVVLGARDREMVRLRGEGLSLEAIGRRLPRGDRPLSKQRVAQVLARAVAVGVEVSAVRGRNPERVNAHTAAAALRRHEARRLFLAGLPVVAVRLHVGVGSRTLRSYLLGVPGFAEVSRRKPRESSLSYTEMSSLRQEGWKLREIAARAGVSASRVSQVLRRQGHYSPSPAVAERITTVCGLLDEGLPVVLVARYVGCSRDRVYAYAALGRGLGSPTAEEVA
jgi:AraC-like DNA-binding protein